MRMLRFSFGAPHWAVVILLTLSQLSVQADDGESRGQAFYAAGTLQRVRRKDNGAERLALLDEQGSLRAFLAPNARANLREYLGKEVAVRGRVLRPDDDDVPYVAVDHVAGRSRPRTGRGNDVTRKIQRVSFADELPAQISTMEHYEEGPMFESPWQPVQGEAIMEGEYIDPPQAIDGGPGYGGYLPGAVYGGASAEVVPVEEWYLWEWQLRRRLVCRQHGAELRWLRPPQLCAVLP